MKIEVKIFATLRLALGRGYVALDVDQPPTVDELIALVSEAVDSDIRPWLVEEDDTIRVGTMILLDGFNILHMQGLDTVVETAHVSIFPPAGGG